MIDFSLEGPWGVGIGCLVLGILFIMIGLIGIDNVIQYITKKRADEPTGIKKPKLISYLSLCFGIVLFALGVFLFVISIKNMNPPSECPPLPLVTQASTIPPTLPPTSTSTITPTPTLTPTSTPTITPTVTQTVTPTYPAEEFANKCIPDYWEVYPSYFMSLKNITPEPCMNYESLGYKAGIIGLQILSEKSEIINPTGITRKLPDGDFEIDISLQVERLVTGSGGPIKFYLAFVNRDPLKEATQSISGLSKSIYFENYDSDLRPIMFFGLDDLLYSIKPSDTIELSCTKKLLVLKCTIPQLPENEQPAEIAFNSDWNYFFVGYELVPFSDVKVTITHFQIIPE